MKHPVLTLFLIMIATMSALPQLAYSDGGILVPVGAGASKSALSLANMEVRVSIDNGMADIAILQIYQSNHDRVLEGRYSFLVPEQAELSGFAIWEEGIRIPGVILERWKAKEVYERHRTGFADPGLMEADDHGVVNRFTCRVSPIIPYGTKRVELFYTQALDIESENMRFTFPLKPTLGKEQKAGHLNFNLEFSSDIPFGDPLFDGENLVLEITEKNKHGFKADLSVSNALLDENIEINIPIPIEKSKVHVMTYRDVKRVWRDISPVNGRNYKDDYGFYGAKVLLGKNESAKITDPKQVVLALDTSLSMQWDKLSKALEVAFFTLANLSPKDKFGVLLFNSNQKAMKDKVEDWSPESAEKADLWIREQSISGGTNFNLMFKAVSKQFDSGGRRFVVLITDGAPTLLELRLNNLLDSFKRSKLNKHGTRIFVVGIGDDANSTFLKDLAGAGKGPYSQIYSNEETTYKSKQLMERMSSEIIEDIRLEFHGVKTMENYPKGTDVAFGGGSVDFIGRYDALGKGKVKVHFKVGDKVRTVIGDAVFNDVATDHIGLRRRWAKARVMELLDKINREGEKSHWIEEVIALSRQFTFVTPYTSFLAAPRSLLRPRVIRPGDPLLRVKTDPSIKEVVASFPFGLTRKMIYLKDEDTWQLRFLAPEGWPDGSYLCKLYLTDIKGRQFIEEKRFILDGRPPEIFPKIAGPFRAGTSVELVAAADSDTRRLTAKIESAGYCELRYDHSRKVSVGRINLPANMILGSHKISWFAEDFAHNITRLTQDVEVIGYE